MLSRKIVSVVLIAFAALAVLTASQHVTTRDEAVLVADGPAPTPTPIPLPNMAAA